MRKVRTPAEIALPAGRRFATIRAVTTFGERVRGAMAVAGMTTPAELAKACGISRQTAMNWLSMREPELSGVRLLALAKCLNVRINWLAEGDNRMERPTEHTRRAERLLSKMTDEQAEEWLACGEKKAA